MRRFPCVLCLAVVTLAAAQCAMGAGDTGKGVVTDITQSQYKELVSDYTKGEWNFRGSRPAIVDFSATWCGPCKRLAPILDELAAEYSGEIDFYKVDVDQCPQLSQAYGVRSVPMVLFCPVDGRPEAITGLYPKEELVRVIDAVLLK